MPTNQRPPINPEYASALLALWETGPDRLQHKTRLNMGFLSDLAWELAHVYIPATHVAKTLDRAGIWRHHNSGHTSSTAWLHPDTGVALERLASPPEKAARKPPKQPLALEIPINAQMPLSG